MTTETSTLTPEEKMHQASEHLYMALHGRLGPVDFSPEQRIVRAISEFGDANRRHASEDEIAKATEHVYMALHGRFGPMDFSPEQRIVRALAEFGQACREVGSARGN
ncbi:MAG: hypothetical protein ACSLFM_11160 [Tepidiformaceae bacterium]